MLHPEIYTFWKNKTRSLLFSFNVVIFTKGKDPIPIYERAKNNEGKNPQKDVGYFYSSFPGPVR